MNGCCSVFGSIMVYILWLWSVMVSEDFLVDFMQLILFCYVLIIVHDGQSQVVENHGHSLDISEVWRSYVADRAY